ncbi:MAG TPA: ATP-binding protein [Bryobacteraceae bacterium]|nr:ATP-binding protein [Bryobacteraceae bacterium]
MPSHPDPNAPSRRSFFRLRVGRIVATYVSVALVWIVASHYAADLVHFRFLPAVEGTLFVLVTGAWLYAVLSHAVESIRASRRRLVASEERFRRVVEHAPIGIFIAANGRFQYLNPAAQKILGAASQQQLRDATVLDRVDASCRDAEEARLRSVVTEHATAHFEREQWVRLDGSPVEVTVSAVPFERDGEPGALVFFDDISEQTRNEGQRRILEEQFRQAQKLESVGRLAGGVAHDFNNLLTIISGYSQMLREDIPLDERIRDPLDQIFRAAARAADLTRQLLTFSRRQISAPQKVAVNELLGGIEKMLRRLIGEDIRLILSLSPDAGAISVDPGQFEQVIMNLAVNARDAMPQGGRLAIETARVVAGDSSAHSPLAIPPGVYAAVTVSDTGTGMSAEAKAHVFEPFFTTKEPGKGTGLGLSTVYGIVKQSGGSIWADSAPGQGCVFRMLFPAVEPGFTAAEAPAPAVKLSGTETVLLAEDEPGVRKYVHQALERYGYTVLDAANGREALACAESCGRPIHLLLTDCVMPEMGGAELASLFQSRRPGVPVLCMSGYIDQPRAPSSAAVHHIQKPFTAEALLGRMRSLLQASHTA